MLIDSLLVVLGLLLLAVGSEGLVRGAGALALRLGIAPLVVGLTVVAFATGSPELFVSVQAAMTGNSGIALGNVVGSNISNIALVLGLAAVVRPMTVRAQLVRREMPLLIAATLALCVLMADGVLGRLDGLLLVVAAVVYTAFAYVGSSQGDADIVSTEFEAPVDAQWRPWRDVPFLIGGLVALVIGAEFLVRGASAAASALGISQAVIALTVIAIGTSLPELATSVTAARRDQADVAFGNVIGSNMLNILGVLGLAALIQPFSVQVLRPLDLGMLVATAVLLLLLMMRGWVLNRVEGLLLLAVYAGYLASLAT